MKERSLGVELRRVGPTAGEPEGVGDQPLAAERLALDDPEELSVRGTWLLDPDGKLDRPGPFGYRDLRSLLDPVGGGQGGRLRLLRGGREASGPMTGDGAGVGTGVGFGAEMSSRAVRSMSAYLAHPLLGQAEQAAR